MADPLSIAASVIAVLQLAGTAIQFVKDVKDGSSDRIKLRDELRSTTCVLEMLRDRVEDPQSSGEVTLRSEFLVALSAPGGPLNMLQKLLQDIITKLEPRHRLIRLAQPFTWPFTKKEVAETLTALERLKSDINLIIQGGIVELVKLSNLKLDNVSNQVGSLLRRDGGGEAAKVLAWISSMSFSAKQADILQRVQPGTCQWFLNHSTYLGWRDGDIQTLWCPGIPGAGKTRLVSLVVDQLQNVSADQALAYIYCDYQNREAQTPLKLLSSILAQVAIHSGGDDLPPALLSLYESHKKYDTRPTLTEICGVLGKICSSLKAVRVVLDALDECCEPEDEALEVVSNILAIGPPVRLLCTSRFSMTFETFFRGKPRIEISARDEDIRAVVDAHILTQTRLCRHIQADPTLQESIVSSIIGVSQGMFLLAALHLESLARKISRKEVRACLRALPRTLDATYEQALRRIRSQADEYAELAESVLFWVLCARENLTISQLQHLYAIRSIHDGEMLGDDDLPDTETLTSACSGLMVIDGISRSVRLVHYTAQEYFQRVHQGQIISTKFDMTRSSITYLTLPNFGDGICASDKAMTARLDGFPLLPYAARHWGAEGAAVDWDALWSKLAEFASNRVAVSVANQARELPRHRNAQWSQEFPRDVPALVLTASFDLPALLRRLVEAGHDIEGKGSDMETPLIRAASLGLTANVSELIDLGAAVNVTDTNGETALGRAAASGNIAVARVLLAGGADVNMKSAAGWTVLMSAVSSGSLDMVQMITQAKADISSQTDWGDSALSLATRSGHEAIAFYLAGQGAVLPNSVAGRRSSVVASRKGLGALVRRLTADYDALAAEQLQRQGHALAGELAAIAEVDEPREDDPSARHSHLSEVLDGLDYTRGFHRRYKLIEKLGKGHHAEVHLCKSKITGVRYAVKIFKTPKLFSPMDMSLFRSEIIALKTTHHPNILRLVDVAVQDAMDEMFMVMELAPEGELFNLIVSKGKFSEDESRKLFSQLFSALAYLHKEGWVHRDVKPENIVLLDKDLTIRLADFGLCKKLKDNACNIGGSELTTTLCGTPSYVAPEVLAGDKSRLYSYKVDIWSAGVVLYICLCGFPPFSDELYSEAFPYSLAQQIKSARFDYPSPYWDSVGDVALDLIDRMILVDQETRYTADQCLKHPWMTAS